MTQAIDSKRTAAFGLRRWAGITFVVIFAAFSTHWGGCSVEKHYDLLSFFFDGVPDPNAINPASLDQISKSPTFSEHQPFGQDACLKCHTDPTQLRLEIDDSSICITCHEGITEQFPVMHGAVTGLGCLMCHNPHLSPLPHLLREMAPQLCLQCHDRSTMGSPTPPHEDLTTDCLSCHGGHGGDRPFFLKPLGTQEQTEENTPQTEGSDAP